MTFFVCLFFLLSCFLGMISSQSYYTTTWYEPGNNCSTPANERVGWTSTGYCLPQSDPTWCNNKANTCGVIYNCDPSTVTSLFWYSAGNQCLRGNSEGTKITPTNSCITAKDGWNWKGYDYILTCFPQIKKDNN